MFVVVLSIFVLFFWGRQLWFSFTVLFASVYNLYICACKPGEGALVFCVGGKKALFVSNTLSAILAIQLMLTEKINFTLNNTKMRYLFRDGFTCRMTTKVNVCGYSLFSEMIIYYSIFFVGLLKSIFFPFSGIQFLFEY